METVIRIELRKGFDHVILTLDHSREALPYFVTDNDGQVLSAEMREGDVYRVSGTGLYSTAHGFVAGDTREFSFRDEGEAKAKANGWFAKLVRQGFERIA